MSVARNGKHHKFISLDLFFLRVVVTQANYNAQTVAFATRSDC